MSSEESFPQAAMDAATHPGEVMKDLTAGVIGGCSGIVVGQPFDTVKVRLQTLSGRYRGPMDCVRRTFRNEGLRGFFKGMASPLFSSAWINAIVFSAYGSTVRYIEGSGNVEPALSTVFIAGTWAGFLQTFCIGPADLIKCKLQIQDDKKNQAYRGPLDCARQIVRKRGVLGLYQGWLATAVRETPSFGVYFWSYEATKRALSPEPSEETSVTTMLIAGGVAGLSGWFLCYPVDVVKSKIQTLPEDAPKREFSMNYQFRTLYAREGMHAFTRGLGTTLARAFPVNAVTLMFYEVTLKALSQ